MNTLYPDATAEELQAADNVCIICREEMTTASKKLPCNHIFHTSCLRSWFQRQQTCPTCRLNILRPTPIHTAQQAPVAPQQAQPQPAGVAEAHAQPNQPQVAGAIPNPFQPGINLFQPGMNPFQVLGGGTAGPNITNGTANNPLIVPPFPPFPFMPFMSPPPIPPQNMQSLTTEELRRMEGNERANIEARIECLRNIQVMLDAAVLMMQQYCAAAAISAPTPATTATISQQTDEINEEPASPSSSTQDTSDTLPISEIKTEPALSPTPSTSYVINAIKIEQPPSPSSSTDSVGETDELRRRRLQHFEQQRQ